MVRSRIVPRRALAAAPGLPVLGRQGGDAVVGVDRELEMVEEVPTEKTVHAPLLDVVRDDQELADLRVTDLEGVECRRLHARGPRRAADLAGRPLREGHPGLPERTGRDHGPGGAGVQLPLY